MGPRLLPGAIHEHEAFRQRGHRGSILGIHPRDSVRSVGVGHEAGVAEQTEQLDVVVTRKHVDRFEAQRVKRDGRTLTELESGLEMTRFGVMKHLRVLEDAGLVITRRQGREKLHFLNPVPIRLIHDRWIDKYTERQVSALANLKHELEETG